MSSLRRRWVVDTSRQMRAMWMCKDVWGANRNYRGTIGGVRVSSSRRYTSNFKPSVQLSHDGNTLFSALPCSSCNGGYRIQFD